MSKKNLLIVALLLVAVAAFVQVYSKRDNRRGETLVDKPLASLDLVGNIDEVVIEKGKDVLHLQKKDNSWVIPAKDSFPADTRKLVKLLDNITSYRIADLVTKDRNRLADFELADTDPGGGILLTLKSGGNSVYRLTVGKSRDSVSADQNQPSRPDGTYVRIGTTPEVYLIKENLTLSTAIDDWMRTVLVTISKDQIKSIRIANPESRFSLERADDKAELVISDISKGETANKQALQDVMDELEAFTVNTALPQQDSLKKVLKLKSEVTAILFDGSILNFQILGESKKDPSAKKAAESESLTYYARFISVGPSADKPDWQELNSMKDKWLFELDEWRAKNWTKSRKEFVQTPGK